MSNYFLAADTETGGLRVKEADILTLYMAVTDEDFKIIDELDLKLKPNDRMPLANPEALAVNKIDIAKHMADPATITYKEARIKIIEFAKKYLKKSGRYSNLIPLGHNLQFDLRFIFEYIISDEEWETIFSYNYEDTKTSGLFLKRAGWIPRELGTLKSFVEYFNIPKREAHEAKGDVAMTVDVYKKMIELMESKKSGGSSQDLITLLEQE